jgi:hypothetical protein
LERRPLGVKIIVLVEAIFAIAQFYSIVITPWDIFLTSTLFELIGIVLSLSASAGLWQMKKWSVALTIVVLSMSVVKALQEIQTVFSHVNGGVEFVTIFNQVFAYILLVFNVIALIYLFKKLYQGIFH